MKIPFPFRLTEILLLATLTLARKAHGQSQPPNYALIDLGTLGGNYSGANAINAAGQVVGTSDNTSSIRHAFLYSNGTMHDLGTLGGNYSAANGINDAGQVVGESFITTSDPNRHAFLYSNGSIVSIGTILGSTSGAYGINNNGQIVGYAAISSINGLAFLYSGSSMRIFNPFGGSYGTAYGLNGNGQVIGTSSFPGNSSEHAFIYYNGVIQDLGTLGGSSSIAYGINNSGQVVGQSTALVGTSYYNHAFLYEHGTMMDLGTLHLPSDWTAAYSINATGQIVGVSYINANGDSHAFLYFNGQIYDLNNLLFNRTSGWELTGAAGINDTGQIIGTGFNPSGQYRAYLLNPLNSGSVQVISTPQPALPTYGICPASGAGKDSLIVITHGWIFSDITPVDSVTANASVAWVDSISNSIVQYLSAKSLDHWKVIGYKWIDKANIPILNGGPQTALNNAKQEGTILGNSIVAQGWTHVHLIAHSAGAELIQAASEAIKANSPSAIVHCTFLDAFVGFDKSGLANYGKCTDWSDSYFTHDALTGGEVWQLTEGSLSHAYNVDVTQLDVIDRVQIPGFVSTVGGLSHSCYKTESVHFWPVIFYSNTITGNVTSGYLGFGMPLSEEAGTWSSTLANWPVGNSTARILGAPDPTCTELLQVTTPAYTGNAISFPPSSSISSPSGFLNSFPGSLQIGTGSPAWIATIVTDTNVLNLLTFDAQFTSAAGSHGLLSVYWDTNMIALVDETAVQPGLQHYALSFPNTAANASHVLGIHLDPFTPTQSTMTLTNIFVGSSGVTQPFSLSITTNVSNGLLVYQLTGQPANYHVQASEDLLNWTNVAFLANTDGTVKFVDSGSANYPTRFYRATSP
jgi:probable HAF family extracellular repeat protein